MGCASSKQKRCRHCNAPYSPVPRSYSVHVHHPPQDEEDSYHVVALTSTTLGSLKLESKLDSPVPLGYKVAENKGENGFKFFNDNDSFQFSSNVENKKAKEFSMGVIEAKTWSEMIEQKLPKSIPKTPTRTPPGEPETINTWELMEGLEDISPLRSPNHFRSFSFDVHRHPAPLDRTQSNLAENVTGPPEPIWHQIREDESNLKPEISEFDPQVISMFKKSLEELSPESPFHLRRVDHEKQHNTAANSFSFDITEEKRIDGDDAMDLKCQGKEKVVVYFTSLRGVRKTYEDCCHVRVILKSLGIRVDERDVSMHSAFKEELKELLGDGCIAGGLPRVFVGRNYIGGVEEIQKLHEDGQLEKLLHSCEKVDNGDGDDGNGVCEVCGDIRFVPCETCCGSCKIYYEDDQEELTVELYYKHAPRTCRNFIELSRRGYYDNVKFHRIIKDFILQSGDPTGTGRGGESIYGPKFEDEIRQELKHTGAGILSMANAGPNTNGSQFFITLAPCPSLDGKHTIFGRVCRGMEIIKRLGSVQTDNSDRPIHDVKILRTSVKD